MAEEGRGLTRRTIVLNSAHMETRTERSGLTLASIVDVALQMAAADGLEA